MSSFREGKKNAVLYMGYNSPLSFKRGVENVIISQSQAFSGEKYCLFIFNGGEKVFRYKRIVYIGIDYNVATIFAINLIVARIRKKKRLIIHSHNYIFTLLCFNKTDLFTVHDGLAYSRSHSPRKIFLPIYCVIEKRCYKKTSFVHFISGFTKANTLFPKNKKNYSIIYNTISLDERGPIQNKANIEKDEIILFSVRGIQERTRIDLLIEFASFCGETDFISEIGKRIKIVVAGKGPLLEYYQNDIRNRKIDNIKLLGYLNDNDLYQQYNNCDVVIVTAEYGEGFGLPIIEGYYFDKPVIASNKCAIPEIIMDKDYLFDNNISDILRALKISINHRAGIFKQYYNENYSQVKILGEYRNLYNSIVTNK